jgi:hypothetical protein
VDTPTNSGGLLFDVAPIEDEDGKKKRPSKRKKQDEPAFVPVSQAEPEPAYGYIAAIDGHYQCDLCGTTLLDLVEKRKVDGETKWLITCGWWCMHSWLVDPIPGLLDEEDSKQASAEFIVRDGGRFDGMTFRQISEQFGRWCIEAIVEKEKSSRAVLAAAAAEWLAKNG